MGQNFSYFWGYFRPSLKCKTTQVPQHDLLHHFITIPDDDDTTQVSGSNLDDVPSSITDNDLSIRVPFIAVNLCNVDDHVNAAKEKDEDSHKERRVSPLVEKKIDIQNGVRSSWPNDPYDFEMEPDIVISFESSSTGSNNEDEGEDHLLLPQASRPLLLPAPAKKEVIKRIGQYNSKQKILLVGEGDFSFSASLAVAFGSASNIIATSLDSQEFLIQNYKKFRTNKLEVETRGGTIIHGVNARNMAKHYKIGKFKFDRIIFNFPHIGTFGKSDADLSKQQNLIGRFLSNARTMICVDGEIHMFFRGIFSTAIWSRILEWMNVSRPIGALQYEMSWFKRYNRGNSWVKRRRRCALTATIYELWRERNLRIFEDK